MNRMLLFFKSIIRKRKLGKEKRRIEKFDLIFINIRSCREDHQLDNTIKMMHQILSPSDYKTQGYQDLLCYIKLRRGQISGRIKEAHQQVGDQILKNIK